MYIDATNDVLLNNETKLKSLKETVKKCSGTTDLKKFSNIKK